MYTQENAFTANVCSNYRDIYLIRRKIARGTWVRAKFRNPGQPRRHRLIPRKAGTAQLPGSRLVTSRAWTPADLGVQVGQVLGHQEELSEAAGGPVQRRPYRCPGVPERYS